MARLLVPDPAPGADVDLDAHYFDVARWVYPLMAAVAALDIPDTLLKGPERFEEVGGWVYVAAVLGFVAAYASLGVIRRRAYHWVVTVSIQAMFVLNQIVVGTATLRL